MNTNLPRTVSELFPSKWLVAADIQKPTTATIIGVDLEELRQADGSKETKLIVTFRNATKRWVTNATQCKALAEKLGTEVFAEWVGARVTLGKGRAQNGKDTIVVTAAVKLPAEGAHMAETPAPAASNPRDQGAAAGMTDEEAAAMWQTNGREEGAS
jgi:hypothetical protein